MVGGPQLMTMGLSQSDGSKGILEIMQPAPSFHICKTWEAEQLSSWLKVMSVSAYRWCQDQNPGANCLAGLLSTLLGTLFLGTSLIWRNTLGLIASPSRGWAVEGSLPPITTDLHLQSFKVKGKQNLPQTGGDICNEMRLAHSTLSSTADRAAKKETRRPGP